MKKTILINLNNQSFQLEEAAYEKLAGYLEDIKRHCGAGADAAEVIADIENSMAEKLKSSITPYKEVITLADINSLIEIMGTAEDFDREVGGSNSENSEDQQEDASDKKVKRKLYRDTDNAVIGGVAAGLGNYFDVDPVLFRIIFCALIFAGGSAFPIYILLWIAMPEAKTAYQKLEMQGQAPTLAAFKNLAKTGKKLQENWKKRWQKHNAMGKIFSLPLIIINGIFLALRKIWNALWPIIKMGFGIILSIISFIFLGAIGVGSLILILYSHSSYQLSFIPISELTNLIPSTWLILTGFLSLAIPTALLLIGGVSIIRKKTLINFTSGSIMIGIWMAAGIFFCAFTLRYFPEIQNKYENYNLLVETKNVVDMKGITEIEANGHLINIFVAANTSTPASLSGRKIDLENIEMKRVGDKLILAEKILETKNEICLNCNLRSIELIVATSSKLKIKVESGASVFDETVVIKENNIEEEKEASTTEKEIINE